MSKPTLGRAWEWKMWGSETRSEAIQGMTEMTLIEGVVGLNIFKKLQLVRGRSHELL